MKNRTNVQIQENYKGRRYFRCIVLFYSVNRLLGKISIFFFIFLFYLCNYVNACIHLL